MEQNYFLFDQKFYKQVKGLAMGAPTSAILAEIFIQHMEHIYLYPILRKQKTFAYYRYVDDIIYNKRKTGIEETLNNFNSIHPSINFTTDRIKHKRINYLDIIIYHKNKQLEFSI
jgi:hypothetical protein